MEDNLNREDLKKYIIDNLGYLIWNELPDHLKKSKDIFEDNLSLEISENFTPFVNKNEYELFFKKDNQVYHIGYVQFVNKNLNKVKFYSAKYPIG